ncbi:hypothetical protein ACSBR2_023538 [Camellia fascicularis]
MRVKKSLGGVWWRKILAPKTLNRQAVLNIIHSAWKTRTPFEELADRQKVLEDTPWSVMDSLLVLQPLQPGMVTSELEFCWCPFWVQVHGLPIEKLTCGHSETIGRHIGWLVSVEAHTEGLLLQRNLLRIRVEVDVTKPLLQGFIFHRKEEGEVPGGAGIKVFYKYEKLSEFCYDCGRIGHDRNSCKFVNREDGLNSGYGPNMRTSVARSLGPLTEPFRRLSHAPELRAPSPLQPRQVLGE